ncbi:hypothetical protein [Enterococcus sp. AZ180]|uniref:hypothetical protein n=1 Tax=Enterococcus sp. AZ180 TaxID=2774961 RepID=UPI003F208E2B
MLKLEPFKKEYEKRYFLKSRSYIEYCRSKVTESFIAAIEKEFKCKLYPPFAKGCAEDALKFLCYNEIFDHDEFFPSFLNPTRIVVWRNNDSQETYLAYLTLTENGIIKLWEKVPGDSRLIKPVNELSYTQWFD